MFGVVVRKFGAWQESVPIVLFPIAVGSDIGFHYSIHSFCLAICLGSVCGSGGLFDVECHDSEPNPQLSPAFIGLLNNLRDYNAPKSIYSPGQVTLLCK